MNRNTIMQFKEEFAHWLNTGKIFARKLGEKDNWIELGPDNKKLFRKGYEYSTINEKVLKIGDFVRVGDHAGVIITIKQKFANIQLAGNRISKTEEFIKEWEPREDELCLFWNNDVNSTFVARFIETDQKTKKHKSLDGSFDSIAPFIGTYTGAKYESN